MPAANPQGHSVSLQGLKWKDEIALIDELELDTSYQRHVVDRLVNIIAADYNPILAGKLIVSRRNGSSYIVDGQQRWHGARYAGIDKVAIIGVYGLDQQAEAEMFLALNEGRVAVRAIDNFRAAFHAQAPYALEIVSVVEENEGRIEGIREPRRDSDIKAVEALRWVHRRGGRRGLDATLKVITDAFGELTQPNCPGMLVKGVFAVISVHRDEIDRSRLARQIGKSGTGQLASLAHGMGQVLGAAAGQRSYYLAVLEAYNKRLGAKAIEPAGTLNRIAKAWKDEEDADG